MFSVNRSIFLSPVFFFWAIVFLFCAAGYLDTADALPSVVTAKNILSSFRFGMETPPLDEFFFHQGKDSLWYSKMGFMMPILYLPLVAVAKGLAGGSPLEIATTDFLVSLVSPLVCAILATALFFHWKGELASPRKAFLFVALLVFGTFLLPYSKSAHREPFQALCLTLCFLGARKSNWLASGIWGAFGILTKEVFVFSLGGVVLYLFLQHRQKLVTKSQIVLFTAPILMAGILWLLYGWYLHGEPLNTGYSSAVRSFSDEPWSRPFWQGLWEQLFSLQRGFFVYSPVFLFLVPLAIKHRKWKAFEVGLVTSIAIQVVLYSKWKVIGEALGPRFLLVIAPLCAVLMVEFLKPLPSLFPKPFFLRALCLLVLVVSIALQIVNTSIKMQQYWAVKGSHSIKDAHWVVNGKLFGRKWRGEPEIYNLSEFGGPSEIEVDVSKHLTLRGFNYWWLHANTFRKNLKGSLTDT